jgi:DNA invertase Pin-like site-specific DNA recombinase
MVRAGLYARVSREEMAAGYSIDTQLNSMRQYAQQRGWSVIEYIEPGHTARTDDRPVFQDLLFDADVGKLDAVMVHRLDRGFRNLEDQLRDLRRLRELGIAFVSVQEGFDDSSSHGRFTQNIKGAVNQYYSDLLSEKTRDGKRARAKDGLSNASTTPYGYQHNGDGPNQPDPECSSAVVLAFESYASGKHSDNDVAGILNREGYPPNGRAESGRWTREAVRYLLTNAYYAGWVRHGADLFPGQHPALIDQALFDQVQALRQARGMGRGGTRKPDRVYLLGGLAKCHLCELPLAGQTYIDRKRLHRQYLRDMADRRGFDCPVGGTSVRIAPLDAQIGALVAGLILPDDWRSQILDLVECEDRRAAVERERARLSEKLRRLQRSYFEVEIDDATYRRERAETKAQLDALVIPDAPDVVAAGQFLESLAAIWAEATQAERHELLGMLLEAVFVDVAGDSIVCVQPKAPFVMLFSQVSTLKEQGGCFYFAERGGL